MLYLVLSPIQPRLLAHYSVHKEECLTEYLHAEVYLEKSLSEKENQRAVKSRKIDSFNFIFGMFATVPL